MPIRVAIVDDDAPYRGAIAELLALEPAFALAGSYADARELLAAAGEAVAGAEPPWDLVLMDIEMPGFDGIAAAGELKARHPDLLVVMLTSFEDPERIVRAILAGADGYLVKRSDAREVLEEVRAVVAGGSPLTPSVARLLLATVRAGRALPGRGAKRAGVAGVAGAARAGGAGGAAGAGAAGSGGAGGPMGSDEALTPYGLSERETDVLRALVEGKGYKEIAYHLHISVDTVRSHIRKIYRKLQVHSAPEAVARAIRERIV